MEMRGKFKVKIYKILLLTGIVFAISFNSMGFELKIKRDPFMDLLKYRELKKQEIMVEQQKKVPNFLNKEAEFIKSSLVVKMIVTSNNPNSKAALIVGPSGIPLVVVKGTKLRKGVIVSDIKSDAVDIRISDGKKSKTVTLKIAR